MSLIANYVIFYFLLKVPLINSELFQYTNPSVLQQAMKLMLLKPCIFERLNPLVISIDIHDIISESWAEERIPTILIGPNFEIDNNSAMFLPELPAFILSTNKLQEILQKTKSSARWNIDSRFLIVDISKKCDNAWNILHIMWKMNLLSSLLICQDIDDSIAFYTYNPYANHAPYPWQHVKSTFNERGQQWTLFKRHYSKGQYDCSNLFFDKTKHLNGSGVIVVAITRPEVSTEVGKVYNISSMEKKMPLFVTASFKEIFSALNLTPIIHYIDLTKPKNFKNQTLDGLIHNLVDGTYDIGLNYLSVLDYNDNLDLLYPRHTGIFIILTRHNKIVSSVQELGFVFGIETIILTAFIFTITLIVLVLCKNSQFGSALLEILSLLLSISMNFKFYRHSLRIFVASVLSFVIFMNVIYQSKMSAYSTRLNREAVNGIDDLLDFKYSIFMMHYIGKLFGVGDWNDEHKKYVHFAENLCFNHVIESNGSHTACFENARINLSIALKYNLHASLIDSHQFESPFVRNHWPLKTRIDLIMSRLSESGFLTLWENIEINDPLSKVKFKEIKKSEEYREIVLSDLYYIFRFVVVSLLISFVVFIVEICIPRLRTVTIIN